jgi:hypothetical protein
MHLRSRLLSGAAGIFLGLSGGVCANMGNMDEGVTVVTQDDNELARTLWVPRRRVPVEVQLIDRSFLSGELYADVKSPDGTPGRVLDRLNDSQETYLPLAGDDRHILLKKSGIAFVRLELDDEEVSNHDFDGTSEVRARLSLSDGTHLDGMIPAAVSPKVRLLDCLNASRQNFTALRRGRQVTLINSAYLLAVTELRDSD